MIMDEQDDSRRIRRSNNNLVVDRISSLPDCILGVILSYLPTYESVATSLLSKRWKFSWLDVHNLDFEPYDHVVAPPDDAESMSFIRFVNRVLLLTGAKPLNKFSLCWSDDVSLSHVICWLDAAIIRKVRDAVLYYLDAHNLFKFPISGFNCDSLRSLQVRNVSFVYDTTGVCLPWLETLELYDVRFTSKEAFENLINGCPMLHYLKLVVHVEDPDENHDDDDDEEEEEEKFMYIVSSPSLRHICMLSEGRCTLKLKAPSLECFELHGRISEIFVDTSLSSLVEAHFKIEMNGHVSHIGAVRALEHAKYLILSTTSVTRALAVAAVCSSTKFKRLVKLEVCTICCCCVQDFVNNSENLEFLEFYLINGSWLSRSVAPYDVTHGHSRWTAPVEVPRCLSKSLKKVRISGYNGLEDAREMIRFMLEHGIALEDVQIRCKIRRGDEEKLLKEICEFPRKSPACQVRMWASY